MSRKIIVHSDGTGRGTVVLDEDGNQLGGITDVDLSVQANGVVEATLTVSGMAVNMTADVTTVIHTCPLCGDSVEHMCDQTFGNKTPQCESALLLSDPPSRHRCIRGQNHSTNHFDGWRVWD